MRSNERKIHNQFRQGQNSCFKFDDFSQIVAPLSTWSSLLLSWLDRLLPETKKLTILKKKQSAIISSHEVATVSVHLVATEG